MSNTIASDLSGLSANPLYQNQDGESNDKARVWQLEYHNYLWIWRHKAECRQRTAGAGGYMN